MLGPRCGVSAVVAPDGYIYAVGGWNGSSALDLVERYDIASNSWTQLASLNFPRIRPAVAVGRDLQIYVIGGTDANGQPVPGIEVLNGSSWQMWSATVVDARVAVTGLDGDIYTFSAGNGAPWGVFNGQTWMAQGTMQPTSTGNFPAVAGPDGFFYFPGIGIQSKIGSSLATSQDLFGTGFNSSHLQEARNEAGGATAAEGRIFLTGGQKFNNAPFGDPSSFVLSSVEAYGPVNAPVLSDMSAWFKFDEVGTTNSVVDYFGNLTTSAAVGNPPRPASRVGRGIRLNGLTQWVNVSGPGVDFADGDMSIEGWVRWIRPANTNQVITLIDKRTYSNGKYQGYSVYFYKGRLGVQLANGTTYVNYGATRTIPHYKWTHIAITLDRSTKLLSVYVNGVLDKTWVPLAGNTDNGSPLLIGRHAINPDVYRMYFGLVDELTFYKRALRWAEVRAIFLAGREGKEYF